MRPSRTRRPQVVAGALVLLAATLTAGCVDGGPTPSGGGIDVPPDPTQSVTTTSAAAPEDATTTPDNGTTVDWHSMANHSWFGLSFDLTFTEECLVQIGMGGVMDGSAGWLRIWDDEGEASALFTPGAGLQLAGNSVGFEDPGTKIWYATVGSRSGSEGTLHVLLAGSNLKAVPGTPSASLEVKCKGEAATSGLGVSRDGGIFTSTTMTGGYSMFVREPNTGNSEAAAVAHAAFTSEGDGGLVQVLVPRSEQVAAHRTSISTPEETEEHTSAPFEGLLEVVRGGPGGYSVEVTGGALQTNGEIVAMFMELEMLDGLEQLPPVEDSSTEAV